MIKQKKYVKAAALTLAAVLQSAVLCSCARADIPPSFEENTARMDVSMRPAAVIPEAEIHDYDRFRKERDSYVLSLDEYAAGRYDEVERILPEGQLGGTALLYLAVTGGYRGGVHLLGLLDRDGGMVDALYCSFWCQRQHPCHIGAAAASHVKDIPIIGDFHKGESPFRHAGVGASIHTIHHHASEETLRLAGVVEDLA